MGDIVQFKIPKAKDRHRGKTLCRRGFHKWVVDKTTPYDVKQGKMVTLYRCSRCQATKTESQ
jgi:hypothetical protein